MGEEKQPVGSAVAKRATALLEGAIDLHVHPGPSAQPRLADSLELARMAKDCGMRGALLKDHDRQTIAEAAIVNNQIGDSSFSFFGSVCLNSPAGGVNPSAAEAALDVGCRAVFMPTDNALNDLHFWENEARRGAERTKFLRDEKRQWVQRYSVLDESGVLTDAAKATIALCAQHQALVCTGHIGAAEITQVVEEAARAGAQVVVTHARVLTGATPEDLQRWIDRGALLEVTYVNCCQAMRERIPPSIRWTVAEEARYIESMGAAAFVLSSDFGQASNVPPAQGLAEFIDGLLAEGMSEADIETMSHHNPAKALGFAVSTASR